MLSFSFQNQSHAHLLNHLKKTHPPLNPAPQSNLLKDLKGVQKSLHQRSQNGAQKILHRRNLNGAQRNLHRKNQNGALKSQKKRENQNGKSLKKAKNQAGKSKKTLRKAEIGKRNKTFVKLK